MDLSAIGADLSPHYFSAKPGALMKAKEKLAAGDKQLAKALKKLVKDADKALAEPLPTVMSKEKMPPSGDKHDYMSIAPYFWPNPDTKDGLPYVRHDGKVNPESRDPKANDSPAIKIMGDNVESLALAYYFTGNETYAEGAAKVARTWFLDPATRMTPHLKYAQAIMGVNDGRGTGILEALHISVAADALGLLAESKSWPKDDQQALKEWLRTYHDWLIQSEPGKDEQNAKNNHGTFYDVQAVRIALVLGRDDSAKRMLEEAKQRRIAVQIDPDGKQPLELDRTTSFSYSRFNLFALTELATLGEHAGVDLWNYTTEDGRSIRKAIDFMLPYADVPPKAWTLPQIKDKHESEFMPIFRQATLAYGGEAYEAIIGKYEDSPSKRFQLLFVK
ncbi:MAG: alginate lyase family protein [Prosthecobacter sp.]